MPEILYHLSDVAGITCFEPRPVPSPDSGQSGKMVWTVDSDHVHNYLLPRDCPRVTFYTLPHSKPEDVERLMGTTSARYVVAFESRWLPEVMRQRLYRYEFSAESFAVVDEGAGYWISREAVVPHAVREIDDLLGELARHDVELRVMPSLWKLRDAVVASTLQFSIIRMRNALPREGGA